MNVTRDDIDRIKSDAFAANSRSYFYSCNFAMLDKNENDNSYAKQWSSKTGGYVTGFNGRSDYSNIYDNEGDGLIDKLMRWTGTYNGKNAKNYPAPGYQVDRDEDGTPNGGQSNERTETRTYYNGVLNYASTSR